MIYLCDTAEAYERGIVAEPYCMIDDSSMSHSSNKQKALYRKSKKKLKKSMAKALKAFNNRERKGLHYYGF